MSAIFANISGIAALGVIIAALFAVATLLVGSIIGRPLDADAQELVRQLLAVLFGLAIGSTAVGVPLANRIAHANEVIAQLAIQSHHTNPPPPPMIDPKRYI